MTRLQGAHAPQPLLGGWTQQPGRLPRVLPSAEAKSSRGDFAAEVERNESGGRARCWEMEAERLPPIHQRRDAVYPPWHHANRGSLGTALCFCLDASTLMVRAGCQGHFHTLEVMQAGITPRGSVATWLALRLRDPEEQLWQTQRKVSGSFVSAVTIRSSSIKIQLPAHRVTQRRLLLTNSSICNTLQRHHHTHHFVCGLMGNFLNPFATFK